MQGTKQTVRQAQRRWAWSRRMDRAAGGPGVPLERQKGEAQAGVSLGGLQAGMGVWPTEVLAGAPVTCHWLSSG